MFVGSSKALAEFVRSRRLASGITQQELGDLTGMSRRWVQELEAGKHVPSLEAAIKVAAVFEYEWHLERAEDSSELDALFEELS